MRPREAFAPDKAHYVSLTLDEILGSAGVSLEDAFGADPNHLPPPALQFPPLRLSGSTVTVHVNYYEASDGELPIPLPEPFLFLAIELRGFVVRVSRKQRALHQYFC